MSYYHAMNFRLPAGQHFGAISKSYDVAGFTLTQTAYAPNLKLPRRRCELAQGRTIPPIRTTIAAREKELSAEERQQVENNLKQMGAPKIRAPYHRLPAELQAARLWVLAQPRHYTADSYPFFEEEFAAVYAARQKQEYPLGAAPLAVLLQKPGYGDPPPGVSAEEWKQINEENQPLIQVIQSTLLGHQAGAQFGFARLLALFQLFVERDLSFEAFLFLFQDIALLRIGCAVDGLLQFLPSFKPGAGWNDITTPRQKSMEFKL